jgi:DNA-binding transcriptional ArsR family regulator
MYKYANGHGTMELPDSLAAAELLKAFSHPTRLAILLELVDGPKCVTDMEELLPARQANISQHLAVLRHAKLVDYAQDGTLRCYYLCRPDLVTDMLDLVGRNDPVVKRSAAEIQADKERLARALAKSSARPKTPGRREAAKR